MADCRSIHTRAAFAPVPTLTLADLEGRRGCCQSGHSAIIRDLSAATRWLLFGYQQLMHKNCDQPHYAFKLIDLADGP